MRKELIYLFFVFSLFSYNFFGNLKTPFTLPQNVDICSSFLYPERENFIQSDLYFDCGDLLSLREGDELPRIILKTAKDCHAFIFHLNTNGDYMLIWPEDIEKSFIEKDNIIITDGKYYLSGKYSGIEYFQIFLFERIDGILWQDLRHMYRFQKNGTYTCNFPFYDENYMGRIEKSGIAWGLNTISYDYNGFFGRTIKFIRNNTQKPFFVNGRLHGAEEKIFLVREKEFFITYYEGNTRKTCMIDDYDPEKIVVIGE